MGDTFTKVGLFVTRQAKHKKGFSLVEIMIVIAIMGILGAMVLPHINRARSTSYRLQCIVTMRKIAAAKEHWSLETVALDTAIPTAAQLDPYIDGGTSNLTCPIDPNSSFATSYNINNMLTNPTCKIDASHVL